MFVIRSPRGFWDGVDYTLALVNARRYSTGIEAAWEMADLDVDAQIVCATCGVDPCRLTLDFANT